MASQKTADSVKSLVTDFQLKPAKNSQILLKNLFF